MALTGYYPTISISIMRLINSELLHHPNLLSYLNYNSTQVKVQIDGIKTHTIGPADGEDSLGLDDGETKEFCLHGKKKSLLSLNSFQRDCNNLN